MQVPVRTAAMTAFAVLALSSSASGATSAKDPARTAAEAYRTTHERAILTDFTTFLAMPNVATTIPDVEKNATHLSGLLQQRGFQTRLLSAGAGTPPTVYGELKTPGAKRTVLYYAHYDGQPIGQKGWLSAPFEPVMRAGALGKDDTVVDWRAGTGPISPDWRIYARGAGDDKGSIQALLSAMDALKAKGRKPSVNIKVFYEGEEEQGSPNLATIVGQNRDLLKCDLIVMGDGPMHQSGRQLVNYGSRGLAGVTLKVFGPLRPLHDGHYGSWVPSPSVEIAHLLAGLRDENGDIRIAGFYDDVVPPTASEKAALAALPPVEAQLQASLGIGAPATDQRLADSYFRPTLNIRSIHVGDTGENAANALSTSAFASIDFRIVPNETPERVRTLLEAHLRAKGWFIVDSAPDIATRLAHPKIVLVRWEPGNMPAKTDMDSPGPKAASLVIERVEGSPVLRMPMVGASSGIAVMTSILNAPMVGVSIANYDDNQHAENENLRIGNLWDGIAVYAGLLSELDW